MTEKTAGATHEILESDHGSTLIGAIIMSAVILTLSVGMFGFLIFQTYKNKAIENQVSIAMIVSAIRTVLFDPVLCTASLKGQSAAPDTEVLLSNVAIEGQVGTLGIYSNPLSSNFTATNKWPNIEILSARLENYGYTPGHPGAKVYAGLCVTPPIKAPAPPCAPSYFFMNYYVRLQQPQKMGPVAVEGPWHVGANPYHVDVRQIVLPLEVVVVNGAGVPDPTGPKAGDFIGSCHSMGEYPDPNNPGFMAGFSDWDLCYYMGGTSVFGPPFKCTLP